MEDALASGSPGRIGLAWAVAIVDRGRDLPLRKIAAEMGFEEDREYKELQGQLTGRRNIRLDLLDRVAAHLASLGSEFAGMHHGNLMSGAHPFAYRRTSGGGACEPDDPEWEVAYSTVRLPNPDAPSASELRQKYPLLFP